MKYKVGKKVRVRVFGRTNKGIENVYLVGNVVEHNDIGYVVKINQEETPFERDYVEVSSSYIKGYRIRKSDK